MTYRHTQQGTLILALCPLIKAFGVGFSLWSRQWPPVVIMTIMMVRGRLKMPWKYGLSR